MNSEKTNGQGVPPVEQPSKAPKNSKPHCSPETLRELARSWCEVIGPRAAARKLAIPEGTVTQWASRFKWPVPKVFQPIRDYASRRLERQGVAIARETYAEVMKENGENSRLYLSSAGLKASHEAATRSGSELLDRNMSQAVLNTARSLDVVHQWSARDPAVSVQIANLVMPTEEEAAATRETHARLDAIVAKLSASKLPQGQ
jgi:hypothetical protein